MESFRVSLATAVRRSLALAAAGATLGLLGAMPLRSSAATRCNVTVYAPSGLTQSRGKLAGPGLVLSGAGFLGMPYEEVLRWLTGQIQTSAKRAGNLLVLQASGENYYSQIFYNASRLASIREITIPPCASRSQVNLVAPYANAADAVLFAGGDQSNYVAWKGSALMNAVKRVYARGGFVGGGSAGLAIQGAVAYDAVGADKVLPDDQDLDSALATRNPYGPAVTFTTGLFAWPALANTITDTHFAKRNRFGRLAAFMARANRTGLVTGSTIYGLGVDEGSTLVVDRNGIATLLEVKDHSYKTRGAYVLVGGSPKQLARGAPLVYTVAVTHLTKVGGTYDLIHHTGAGTHYSVTVDGARAGLYSRDPY